MVSMSSASSKMILSELRSFSRYISLSGYESCFPTCTVPEIKRVQVSMRASQIKTSPDTGSLPDNCQGKERISRMAVRGKRNCLFGFTRNKFRFLLIIIFKLKQIFNFYIEIPGQSHGKLHRWIKLPGFNRVNGEPGYLKPVC